MNGVGATGPNADDAKTRTDGKRRRNSAPAAAVELATADTMPPPFRETRNYVKTIKQIREQRKKS